MITFLDEKLVFNGNGEVDDFIISDDSMDWTMLSRNYKLSEKFMRHFKEKIKWYDLRYFSHLSEEFIEENLDVFDITEVLNNKRFSLPFLNKYADKLKWIFVNPNMLPNEFLKEHIEDINWREQDEIQDVVCLLGNEDRSARLKEIDKAIKKLEKFRKEKRGGRK